MFNKEDFTDQFDWNAKVHLVRYKTSLSLQTRRQEGILLDIIYMGILFGSRYHRSSPSTSNGE